MTWMALHVLFSTRHRYPTTADRIGFSDISPFQGATAFAPPEVGTLSRPLISDPFRVGYNFAPLSSGTAKHIFLICESPRYPQGVRYVKPRPQRYDPFTGVAIYTA